MQLYLLARLLACPYSILQARWLILGLIWYSWGILIGVATGVIMSIYSSCLMLIVWFWWSTCPLAKLFCIVLCHTRISNHVMQVSLQALAGIRLNRQLLVLPPMQSIWWSIMTLQSGPLSVLAVHRICVSTQPMDRRQCLTVKFPSLMPMFSVVLYRRSFAGLYDRLVT